MLTKASLRNGVGHRNTEFFGPRLRVFLTLQDGTEVSVNTADDAVRTWPAVTPIPDHQARDWTFVEDTTARAHCGPQCERLHPPEYVSGAAWSIYRVNWG